VSAISSTDGRLIGMTATTSSGAFTMRGVPAGTYWIHVTPLEGGMTSGNLTGNSTVQTDFAAGFYGSFSAPSSFTVTAGNATSCGTLLVDADVTLKDNANAAVVMRRGQSAIVTIFGTGFTADQMSLTSKSADLTISSVSSASSFVRCTVAVSGTAEFGSYDLYIQAPGGEFDVASGVIEVVPEAPTLIGTDTNTGSTAGGETVTITGTNFQSGAYVLFGGLEAQSVTFTDSTTLVATTPVTSAGTVDLSVHNPDGQQVTSSNAFTFEASPVYSALLPEAGNVDGGTRVYIVGDNFTPQTQVLFDGTASTVTYKTSTVLQAVTPAHAVGTVTVILRNPGSPDRVVNNAFTFVNTPDPTITAFTPGSSPVSGGTLVRVFGTNLSNIASVRFGVDPVSGQGGKLGTLLDLINSGEVRAKTAINSNAGSYGILVTTDTGQAALTAGFTFDAGTSGGSGISLDSGGGGGCSANLTGSRKSDWRTELPGWLLLLGAAWYQRRRQRRKLSKVLVAVE
jgi:hypothetical protein